MSSQNESLVQGAQNYALEQQLVAAEAHNSTTQTRPALGRLVVRAMLSAGLAMGVGVTAGTAETLAEPHPQAAAAADGGYPNADAAPVRPGSPYYEWGYKDRNHCGAFCDSGGGHTDLADGRYYLYSPRGYAVDNCTDWSSFRANQLTDKSVPSNLGNAKTWDNNAPSTWTVDQVPEPGDVAQSEAGTFGHVGVVEAINKNAQGNVTSIEVSQYNEAGDGKYTDPTYTPDANGVFWRDGAHTKKWDNFIDLNGTGKGIHDQDLTTPPPPPPPPPPADTDPTVGTAINPANGSAHIIAQGPNNSMYAYWTSGGNWNGPLGIAGNGTTYSAPAIAYNPSGAATIATQGPGNSLRVYWEANGALQGPLGIGGPGSTYSAPSMVMNPSSGLPIVTAEGPSNTLDVYWETPDAQWHGPLAIGGVGTTYSAPSITNSGGLPVIAAEGGSNTLDVYWEESNGTWHGPLAIGGVGSTQSAPSIAPGPGGLPIIAAQGPSNSLNVYWESAGGTWHGPLGLDSGGTTFSAPSVSSGSNGLPTITAEGPGNTLRTYWENSNGSWSGPLGIGGVGTTYSAPSTATPSGGMPVVAAEGLGGTLDVYWEENNGTWHGPLGIGGVGSTH